jgi:hypothetical protein
VESEQAGSVDTRATIRAGWIIIQCGKSFHYGKPLSFCDWPGPEAWPNTTMPLPENVISP